MQPVKIALVGAGSNSFGPSSVRDIVLSDPLAERGVRLVLMDIVEDHLKDIEPYARHVAEKLGRNVEIEATNDRDGLHPCQMEPLPECIEEMCRLQANILPPLK